MQPELLSFLQFATNIGALQFGEFTLKSGRKSPYFFNTGLFNTGTKIARLGLAYAHTIVAFNIKFDMLYGPAYKGIPLVIATSIALAEHYQISAPYAFNRKEAKDHGEGGIIVGSSLQGKILILDDVISAGISISESIHLIHHHYAEPVAAMIALDRQEHNECHFNLPIFPILRFTDLVDYLATQPNMDAELHRMKLYQAQFNDT